MLRELQQEQRLDKALKLFREYMGITQQDLAQLIHGSSNQISRMERGRFDEIRATRYVMAVCNIIREKTGVVLDAEGLLNRTAQSNSRTGHRGVCYVPHRKKYIVTISALREHYYLGGYDSLEQAISIRRAAELKLSEGPDALRLWIKSL